MRLKEVSSNVEDDSNLRDELGRSENTEERPIIQLNRSQISNVSLWASEGAFLRLVRHQCTAGEALSSSFSTLLDPFPCSTKDCLAVHDSGIEAMGLQLFL